MAILLQDNTCGLQRRLHDQVTLGNDSLPRTNPLYVQLLRLVDHVDRILFNEGRLTCLHGPPLNSGSWSVGFVVSHPFKFWLVNGSKKVPSVVLLMLFSIPLSV